MSGAFIRRNFVFTIKVTYLRNIFAWAIEIYTVITGIEIVTKQPGSIIPDNEKSVTNMNSAVRLKFVHSLWER